MARNTSGRKKIQIVKMEKDANLQVTFSKRRQGLFKKASELCTLCRVGMGLIVFSPGQKVFSFGNPDIRSVIDNFKNDNHNPLIYTQDGLNPTIQNLNSLLTEEMTILEMEKNRKKELDDIKNKREETEKWWEKPPRELDLSQNTCLISALESLKKELVSQPSQHLQAIDPPNYYGGSYNNIVGGGNTDLFDQTRTMFDASASNYNPNMINSNHGPMYGNDNNNVFEAFGPRSNLNLPE
ncbi:agamous-like MADS-box protein AGL62 [Raphanus sativus]|uniref:Agamous-like MADS-box protein AGL62 n=1 Tax=Raphanus sativus TaxID=3726 RepID=A0A6J0JTD4_RAPSA|nr:agamous-like MADS-box protein AGL62 [Raphanus sativus]